MKKFFLWFLSSSELWIVPTFMYWVGYKFCLQYIWKMNAYDAGVLTILFLVAVLGASISEQMKRYLE